MNVYEHLLPVYVVSDTQINYCLRFYQSHEFESSRGDHKDLWTPQLGYLPKQYMSHAVRFKVGLT